MNRFLTSWARTAMTLLALFLFLGGARAQQALPYEYGFEDNDLAADGWVLQGKTANNTGIHTDAKQNGSNGFRFNYSEQSAYLLSPILTGGDAGVEVSFWYKEYSSSYGDEQFQVGYTTDETVTDASAFTYGDVVTASTSWQEYTNTFPAGTKRIAIKYIYNDAFYLYLDDFSFTVPSSCAKPTNILATPNRLGVTLTWTGEAGSYDVAYSMDSSANPEDVIDGTVNTTSYTKDGLTIDTDYFFWLRSNCSATEHSAWAGPISVHIGYCQPGPTSRDGQGITGVSFGVGTDVVNNSDASGLPASKPYYGNYSSMVGAVYVGVPSTIAITTATGDYPYGIVIWVDLDNSLTFTENEIVYKGQCSDGIGTLEALITIPATQATGDYRMRIGGADDAFDDYIAGTSTTAPNPCYTGTYAAFNDYTLRVLDAPSCLPPTNLAVSYTSDDTAELSWTGDATSYDIDVNGTIIENVTGNTYTLTGLSLGTVYEVKIRANCSATDHSVWTSAVSFKTNDCMDVDMCYITYEITCVSGYEQYGWYDSYLLVYDADTDEILDAWTVPQNGSGTETGALQLCPGTNLRFEWYSANASNDAVLIDQIVVKDANSEDIINQTGALAANVSYTVDCTISEFKKPTDFAVSNIGPNSAVLSWTEKGTATAWVVEVTDNDEGETTYVDASTNPFTLTKLTAETEYWVRVRPAGKNTKWSEGVLFNTVYSAPNSLAASNITATSADISWTASSDVNSITLEYAEGTVGGDWYYYDNGTSYSAVGLNGSEFSWGVMFPAGSYTGDVLKKVSIYDYDNMTGSVTIYNDGDTSPSNAIGTKSVSLTGTGAFVEFDFDNLAIDNTKNIWVIFHFESGATYPAATCEDVLDDPNGRWVEINGTWYDLANAGVTGQAFMIRADIGYVFDASAATWTTVPNVTSPYTITGLSPLTDYAVRVKAIYGKKESDWAMTGFRTLDDNPVPSNIVADLVANGATLTWNGTGESYNVKYRTAASDEALFFDDFENGLDNWTIYTDGDAPQTEGWYIYSPTTNSVGTYAYSGSYVASAWSWSSQVAYDADNWLITPLVTFGNSVKFWVYTNSSYPDSYEVKLSTTTNDEADFTTELQAMAPAPTTGWTEVEIDLSAYAGQTGYIAIHHEDNDMNYLLIDNFGIYGSSTPAGAWQDMAVNAATATISGLTTNNGYEYQIQSVKGSNTSEWSEPQSFALLTLGNDATDIRPLLVNNYGRQAHVTLSGRTLFKDGNWNTLTLPFDVDNLASSPLAGATVKSLSDATVNGSSVSLTFSEYPIYASYPYIIKWASGTDIVNPAFANVTISATGGNALGTSDVKFVGYYDVFDVAANNQNIYYMTADNKLKYTTVDRTLKSLRGYFWFSDALVSGPSPVREFILDFGDGTTTSIDQIEDGRLKMDDSVYDLQGRKVDVKNGQLRNGLYIVNGKKTVVNNTNK